MDDYHIKSPFKLQKAPSDDRESSVKMTLEFDYYKIWCNYILLYITEQFYLMYLT